jgi:hypothetical protein
MFMGCTRGENKTLEVCIAETNFMKACLMVLLALAALGAQAQADDSWKFLLNKKVIAKGTPDTEDAAVKLEAATLTMMKTGVFNITYVQSQPTSGWNRSFEITDAGDRSLHTIKLPASSGSATVPLAFLKKQAAAKIPLFVYTISLPNDKKKAAVVRVRRILLCKIEWL